MDIVLPFLLGVALCLIQFLAALPWLAALDPATFRKKAASPSAVGGAAVGVVVAGAFLATLFGVILDEKTLMLWGRLYGAVLHAQLGIDFVVVVFAVLLLLWPKGAAVALATFREGVSLRQPVFLLLLFVGFMLMVVSLVLPYFTFGEDLKMVRELGYDAIMFMGVIFATLLASMSISDEIEGRTAITLMSKPVSRRQFLIGKYLGHLLATGVLTGMLGWLFAWILWLKPIYDPNSGDAPPPPLWLEPNRQAMLDVFGNAASAMVGVTLGGLVWLAEFRDLLPGMILGFCQVSVMLAVAVALATRVPLEVNLITCVVMFALGHLSHVLVIVSAGGNQFVNVVARLFDVFLPGLEMLNLGPLIAREVPPDPMLFRSYLLSSVAYTAMYSTIFLFFGLILFEDRDLA